MAATSPGSGSGSRSELHGTPSCSVAESVLAEHSNCLSMSALTQQMEEYLESTYSVNPFPEPFVRHRLHVVTCLPLAAVDDWFVRRRSRDPLDPQPPADRPASQLPALFAEFETAVGNASVLWTAAATVAAGEWPLASSQAATTGSPGAGLAAQGGPDATAPDRPLTEAAPRGAPVLEGLPPRRRRVHSQRPSQAATPRPESTPASGAAAAVDAVFSQVPGFCHALEPQLRGQGAEPAARGQKRCRSEAAAAAEQLLQHDGRFQETDVPALSDMMGLSTVRSVCPIGGSETVYLLDELARLDSYPALDSLGGGGGGGGKRRPRSRQQHFWRDSDRLPERERAYISCAALAASLAEGAAVSPQAHIAACDRTNMWTVCVSPKGVVDFLNRRISPTGVRLIRALSGRLVRGAAAGHEF